MSLRQCDSTAPAAPAIVSTTLPPARRTGGTAPAASTTGSLAVPTITPPTSATGDGTGTPKMRAGSGAGGFWASATNVIDSGGPGGAAGVAMAAGAARPLLAVRGVRPTGAVAASGCGA